MELVGDGEPFETILGNTVSDYPVDDEKSYEQDMTFFQNLPPVRDVSDEFVPENTGWEQKYQNTLNEIEMVYEPDYASSYPAFVNETPSYENNYDIHDNTDYMEEDTNSSQNDLQDELYSDEITRRVNDSLTQAYDKISAVRNKAIENKERYEKAAAEYDMIVPQQKADKTAYEPDQKDYSDVLVHMSVPTTDEIESIPVQSENSSHKTGVEEAIDFTEIELDKFDMQSADAVFQTLDDVSNELEERKQPVDVDLSKSGAVQTRILDVLSGSDIPLAAQVSGLATRLAQAHEEKRALQSEVLRSNAKYEQLQSSYSVLRMQFEQRNRDVDTAKRDLGFAIKERNKAEQYMNDAKREISRVLSDATMKVEKAEQTVALMKTQSDADRVARLNAEERASKIVDDFTAKQLKLDGIKVKLEEAIRQSEAEKQNAKDIISKVEGRIAEFTQKAVEEVKREQEISRAAQLDIETRDKKIDELQGTIDRLQGINDAYMQEKDFSNAEAAKRLEDLEKEMMSRVEKISEECDGLVKENSRLTEELVKANAKLEANEAIQNIINENKAVSDEEQRIHDELVEERDRAIKQRDEAMAKCSVAITEIEALILQLERSQKEVMRVKTILHNSSNAKTAIEQDKINSFVSEIENIIDECNDDSKAKQDIAIHLSSALTTYRNSIEISQANTYDPVSAFASEETDKAIEQLEINETEETVPMPVVEVKVEAENDSKEPPISENESNEKETESFEIETEEETVDEHSSYLTEEDDGETVIDFDDFSYDDEEDDSEDMVTYDDTDFDENDFDISVEDD